MQVFGKRILLALAVVLASGCSWMRPEIVGMRPRIDGIDLQGVNLVFDIDVKNHYFSAIKAPRFRYALAIEGAEFISAESDTGINLPGREVGTATLPVRVGYLDLWNAFRNLAGANKADYGLSGALLFNAAGREFELPFAHEGTMPIFQAPKLSVVDFKKPEITMGGAAIDLAADISNPNIFSIGVDDLGYVLQLGDIQVGGLTVSSLREIAAGETGRLNFSGKISAWDAISGLLGGGKIGAVSLLPSGKVKTPYGDVALPWGAPRATGRGSGGAFVIK